MDASSSGGEAEETSASQDELTARAAAFVGSYAWRAADSGDLVDIEKLTLGKDGRYDAMAEAGLVDPGVRCVAFPCTLGESGAWNVVKSRGALKLRLRPAGGEPSRSYTASLDSDTRALTLTRNGATAVLFSAAPPACRRGGCSGQICADRNVISTCAWRPEYACYQAATCERQPDGQCGFTQTPALTACLANASR